MAIVRDFAAVDLEDLANRVERVDTVRKGAPVFTMARRTNTLPEAEDLQGGRLTQFVNFGIVEPVIPRAQLSVEGNEVSQVHLVKYIYVNALNQRQVALLKAAYGAMFDFVKVVFARYL